MVSHKRQRALKGVKRRRVKRQLQATERIADLKAKNAVAPPLTRATPVKVAVRAAKIEPRITERLQRSLSQPEVRDGRYSLHTITGKHVKGSVLTARRDPKAVQQHHHSERERRSGLAQAEAGGDCDQVSLHDLRIHAHRKECMHQLRLVMPRAL